mmetsp:Transcript_29767/g.54832  ORF Transcript_29767/g.54832 Transcript_29767/m.54832 type:complete len:238 (-) Transcript_29767:297-1010(-)
MLPRESKFLFTLLSNPNISVLMSAPTIPCRNALCMAIGSAGRGTAGYTKYKSTTNKTPADDDWHLLATKEDIEKFKEWVNSFKGHGAPEWFGSYEVSGRCGSSSGCIAELHRFFDECKRLQKPPLIYYTGHGDSDGDWCFPDGYITFDDVERYHHCHSSGYVVTVISDCCHSGQWVLQSAAKTKMSVFAACGPCECAINCIFSQAFFDRSYEHAEVLRDLDANYTWFNGSSCVERRI